MLPSKLNCLTIQTIEYKNGEEKKSWSKYIAQKFSGKYPNFVTLKHLGFCGLPSPESVCPVQSV